MNSIQTLDQQHLNQLTSNELINQQVDDVEQQFMNHLSSIEELITTLKDKSDERSKALLCYVEERDWVKSIHQSLSVIRRIKDRNNTPVTYAIMGRMSSGKTTILKELLSPDEDSPINHMPARDTETTACAVRWTDKSTFDLIYDVEDNHMLLKTFADQGVERTIQIDLSATNEGIAERVLGLETTAHPAPYDQLCLVPNSEHKRTYKVVKNSSDHGGETLSELAKNSRIAIIGTKSATVTFDQEEQSVLRSLDIVDSPGADATNGRSDIVDKANKVFEHNTHESDILMLVIKPEADSLNLGKNIQEDTAVRWALRCILSGSYSLKRAFIQSLIYEYSKVASKQALFDFVHIEESPLSFSNNDVLTDILIDKFNDSDLFWEWLDRRRQSISAQSYDQFKSCILSILKQDDRFTTEIIDKGRLSFIVNRSFSLFDGQRGFSNGADKSFWSSFVSTTLNGVPGSLKALSQGKWPRIFLMDWDNGEKDIKLFFESDQNTLRKKINILKKTFSNICPIPIIYNDDQKEQMLLNDWLDKVGNNLNYDIDIIKNECKKKKRNQSYKALQTDEDLIKVHDVAQSWWWSQEFVSLSPSVREEIYEWTIDTCMHLLHRNPEIVNHRLGGASFVREKLIEGSMGKILDLKNDELHHKVRQLTQKLCDLDQEFNTRDEDEQRREQIKEWISILNEWPYWSNGCGMIIDEEIIDHIKVIDRSKDIDMYQATDDLISLGCKVGIRQMSKEALMNKLTREELTKWITKVIKEDSSIKLFARVQLTGEKRREESRCKEFVRAVFMRMGVLINRLRHATEDLEFIELCVKSHSDNPILSELRSQLSSIRESTIK